jgi:hypothetical protein
MVYVKWLALMPASLFMAIIGRLLAPILPFFVDKETHRLPRWLSWFATDDNDADGDQGHWERWPGTDPWSTYKRRLAWLLRNVCYGFDIDVLGVDVLPTDSWIVEGDESAGDQSGISGTCYRRVYRGSKLVAFHWYYVKHYRLLRRPCCVRVSLGWKLFSSYEAGRKHHTCYANPIKGWSLRGD